MDFKNRVENHVVKAHTGCLESPVTHLSGVSLSLSRTWPALAIGCEAGRQENIESHENGRKLGTSENNFRFRRQKTDDKGRNVLGNSPPPGPIQLVSILHWNPFSIIAPHNT